MQGNAIIGKAYKWKLSGAIFLCIYEDLETWTGIVIQKHTIKDCVDKVKLGQIYSLNADSEYWIKIKGKLNIPHKDYFNLKIL